MGSMQRSKGQRGERELFALLSDRLGFVVRRNVDQARNGGADGMEIEGWAVEVKRCETLALKKWWEQAVKQAEAVKRKPVLFYRQNGKGWRAVIDACELVTSKLPRGATVEVDLDAWAYLCRENMVSEEKLDELRAKVYG